MEDLIKYRKRFNQPIVFNGLQDGVISPTDIDFVFEVDNKFLLIGECKVEGKDLTIGQKLVLQRLVDNWTAAGKLAIAYYVTHNCHPDDDVVLSDCNVHSVYTSGQWQRKNIKFRDSLMKLAKHWDIDKLKNLK